MQIDTSKDGYSFHSLRYIRLLFFLLLFLKKVFIFLFISVKEQQRGAKTQAEREADSMPTAKRETPSQVSMITPWSEGSAKPLNHVGCPIMVLSL